MLDQLKIAFMPRAFLLVVSCSAVVLLLGSNASAFKSGDIESSKPLSVASIVKVHAPADQPQNNNPATNTIATAKSTTPTSSPVVATVQPSAPSATTTMPNTVTKPVIKYKTSPDPLSNAFSTTLPAPSQTDVNTVITHNGQVTAGTLITSNATKAYKVYYGGDLQFSMPSTSIAKSMGAQYSNPFTVSIPDGQASNQPSLPWNDSNRAAFPVATSSSNSGPGTSWSMELGLASTTTSGTYQIHFTTFRLGGGDIAWQYDGFMTLVVR